LKMIYLLLLITFGLTHAINPLQHQFETKLDYFSTVNEQKFNMRYIVDTSYYDRITNKEYLRPVLFYMGNQGDIWEQYRNSGYITKYLANKWHGLVVFAEHRYFGQSLPFGNKNEAYKAHNNRYLSAENAMMDYVELVKHIRVTYNARRKAFIAFGSGYGGNLAAWSRMNYPNIF